MTYSVNDCVTTLMVILTSWSLQQISLRQLMLLGVSVMPYSKAVIIHKSMSEDQRQVPSCNNEFSVCTSILKISSANYIEEGPLCSCHGYQSAWDEYDNKSLTWYHHERGDWMVHFRFCDRVMTGPTCRSEELGDVVVVLRAEHGQDWSPRLTKFVCNCHNRRYYMRGWMLVNGEWEYEFTCARPTLGRDVNPMCKKEEPCVKHYMDKSGSHSVGYRFLCSCPEGYHCPAGTEGKVKAYGVDADDATGPYIRGYCHKIPGWHHVTEPVS